MRVIQYNTYLDATKLPVLEVEKTYEFEGNTLKNPREITEMFKTVFKLHKRTEEYVYMLATDTRCHLIGLFEISHGTVDASLLSLREIYMRALLCGATGIVIIHNHPSGVTTPSEDDIQITNRIVEAGIIMGITVLDSIIIGDDFYSFQEHDCLLSKTPNEL